MRALILASMATLVLSGLPPAPLAPLPAQPSGARRARIPTRSAPPSSRASDDRDDEFGGYGRGRVRRHARRGCKMRRPLRLPHRHRRQRHERMQQSMRRHRHADGRARILRQLAEHGRRRPGGRAHGPCASQGALRTAPTSPQSYPQPIPGVDANRERYAGEEVAAGPGGRRRAGLDLLRSTSTPAAIPTSAGC